jgi:TatD DNase family protein
MRFSLVVLNMSDETHELVDIGANLGHKSFNDDRREVIERAFAVGVRTLVLTGASVAGSEEALRITGPYPGQLFSTAGVHPHEAAQCTDATIPELKRLAAHRNVVAIGECGLDFYRNFSPRSEQEKWFEAQVVLAEELQMPLFLHERDAHDRFRDILAAARKNVPAVLHCFTGDDEALKVCLDMGLHIGITGWICDERRGTHLRELVRLIPPDRLMIETDAPYLLPRTLPTQPKNRRNEPAFLPHVLVTVAECLGQSVAEVAAATTQTARTFFRLPSRDR